MKKNENVYIFKIKTIYDDKNYKNSRIYYLDYLKEYFDHFL